MRIGLVTREYPPETDWGGIGSFYGQFAKALSDDGHDVEVFTQGIFSDRTERCGDILVHRVVPRRWIFGPRQGGDFAGMPISQIGLFALSLAVAVAGRVRLRHRVKPFDVVEGHEHLGINALVNRIGRGQFATVSRYHTAYHSLVRRRLVDWPRSRMIAWLERQSILSADSRICASRYIDRMAREDFGGLPECDAVIPLLLPHLPSTQNPPIGERCKCVVFAGRMVLELKRPDLAAQVFADLATDFPDWTIEFAGRDIPLKEGGTTWAVCERALASWPGRYKYHGELALPALQELYQKARIVLMPSRFESFGLVALEAMAAGAVPVVSDGTALPEVIGPAGVVFENGSFDDLRSKLRDLLRDENRQADLSVAARTRVLDSFSQERLLKQNVECFERLLANRGAVMSR